MISVEIPNLKDIIAKLPDERKARIVLMRAINRSVPAGKLAASKEVRKEYNVKASKINEATKVTKASTSTLMAKIRWSSPMVNLANFKISPSKRPKKQPKKQMTVQVKKGSKSTYKGAFIGSNGQVFRRVGKARLPIKPLYGPAISQLMGAEKVKEATVTRTQEILALRVEHEIGRMMS